MKQFKILISAIIFFSGLSTLAEIREARSMREVAREITPNTLVIFDLDNTVFEATQTLGTDQFFSYLLKKAEAAGLKENDAVTWALKESGVIQPVTNVQAVEHNTPFFVNALQSRGYAVFALTARPPVWLTGTLQQVHSLGIDFSRTSPRIANPNLTSTKLGQHSKGVLFLAPGAEKGAALLEFLQATNTHPERVIFIDDKVNNVKSVDAALTAAKISVIAFRYGAADARVLAFNPMVAEVQYCHFLNTGAFLPDLIAQKMLSRGYPVSCPKH